MTRAVILARIVTLLIPLAICSIYSTYSIYATFPTVFTFNDGVEGAKQIVLVPFDCNDVPWIQKSGVRRGRGWERRVEEGGEGGGIQDGADATRGTKRKRMGIKRRKSRGIGRQILLVNVILTIITIAIQGILSTIITITTTTITTITTTTITVMIYIYFSFLCSPTTFIP